MGVVYCLREAGQTFPAVCTIPHTDNGTFANEANTRRGYKPSSLKGGSH